MVSQGKKRTWISADKVDLPKWNLIDSCRRYRGEAEELNTPVVTGVLDTVNIVLTFSRSPGTRSVLAIANMIQRSIQRPLELDPIWEIQNISDTADVIERPFQAIADQTLSWYQTETTR